MTGATQRILALVLVAAVVLVPFTHNGFAIAMMIVVAQNAIAALGLGFLIGTAGEVSLAQAAFFGFGAYGASWLSGHHVDAWLAMIVTALLVGLFAALLGYPTLRLRGHYLTLATLGFGIIGTVIFNEAVGFTGGPSGLGDFGTLHLGGTALSGDLPFYVLTWAVVLIVSVTLHLLRNSWRGRALRAIASSETAAAAMGVAVRARKVEAFVLSAVCGSLGGSLFAFYVGFISPTSFGFEQSVYLLVMVVIGGTATTLGPILGSLVFSATSSALLVAGQRLFASADQSAVSALQIIAFGIILVAVVRLLPKGIVAPPPARAPGEDHAPSAVSRAVEAVQ
jgi:branched-chain amino acid transport system permease protein